MSRHICVSALRAAALIGSFGMMGCNPSAPPENTPPPAASAASSQTPGAKHAAQGSFRPPEALLERVVVQPVRRQPISEPLSVVGRVDFDEHSVARIGASVTGRVTDINGAVGDSVRTGSILAQLHSTELGNAQLAYLKAEAHRTQAARATERARLLHAADVIGSAELQKRETELSVAQVETRAAVDQLRVMGVSANAIAQTARTGAITSVSPVVSTIQGTIVERRVNKGQVVQPADVLFIVADLSRLWVVAQVPESQIGRVAVGQPVQIVVTSSSQPLRGRIAWIADTVNPETRTVTVRSELENPQRSLKPAMLASVMIEPRAVDRLVVPGSAVVRENNQDHVFVRAQDGTFRLVQVTLGNESSGLRVVHSGLQGGEPIVTEGAFHLNNERRRAELEG